MGITAKGLLLFNTIKYLKPQQLMNQVGVRFRKKESFWNFEKKGVQYKNICFWIDRLDNNSVFMERFKPEDLVDCNKLTILSETREFDSWNYLDASHLWNFNVHYLEYLVPLYSLWKSSGDGKYKRKINEILDNWYQNGSKEPDSNQSYTLSLRAVNQLIVSEAVDNEQRLYDSIYAQYKYLLKHQETHLRGNHYLENLKTIVICSVVFYEGDVYEKYIKKLLSELDEEITHDGLHFELSLMYHKIVLEDLMRVAVALKQAGKREYGQIVGFISRMTTALYSLEYGMSRTPLFNDAGDNVAKPTEALLSICKELFSIEPQKKDSIAGYYKLYDGKISMIIDAGALAPSYMPGHGNCDCLSFELFYDGKPIFVNCGTYQYQGDKRKLFRSTSAHNTVVINGHEQSELWGEHRAGRRIKSIKSKTEDDAVIGSYRNFMGEKHARKLRIENGVLEIIDKTSGDGQSYLHLAPGLKYDDGKITGVALDIMITPLNAEISTQIMPYSENFGSIENTECLVFSWRADDARHGYRVKIEEIGTDD